MMTFLGFERHGDHVVNVVGCDVDSAASVMLFRIWLIATQGPALAAEKDVLKLKVIRQTSSSVGVEGTVCIA